jgi:hypothetical protein
MSWGPELYYGNQVPAAKAIHPDGSWSATASSGGKTATLNYNSGADQNLELSGPGKIKAK